MTSIRPEKPETVSQQHIGKSLTVLLASLPRRASDGPAGDLLVNAYKTRLEHLPKGAFDQACNAALSGCQWFPTIAELLKLAEGWTPPSPADLKTLIETRIDQENRLRFDEAIDALRCRTLGQPQIDAMPPQWQRIAVERGYLWALTDGSFIRRPDTDRMDADQRNAHRQRVAELQAEGLL